MRRTRPSLTTEPAQSSIARKAGLHRRTSGNDGDTAQRQRPRPPEVLQGRASGIVRSALGPKCAAPADLPDGMTCWICRVADDGVAQPRSADCRVGAPIERHSRSTTSVRTACRLLSAPSVAGDDARQWTRGRRRRTRAACLLSNDRGDSGTPVVERRLQPAGFPEGSRRRPTGGPAEAGLSSPRVRTLGWSRAVPQAGGAGTSWRRGRRARRPRGRSSPARTPASGRR